MRRQHPIKFAGRYVGLLLALAFFLIPILWMVSTSFKPASEVLHYPPIWIPSHLTLVHYVNVIKGGGLHALFTSLFVASSNTILALLIGVPAAYGLVRYRLGGQNLAMWFFSQRMAPPIAFIVPMFILFRSLHLLDTYQALIILYLTFNLPYVIWMMRGFINEVPVALVESAQLDGCTSWQTFVQIVVPLVRNGLAVTAIFCFIFSWTDFIFALMVARVQVITLTVYLTSFFGSQVNEWGEVFALSVIATVPLFAATMILSQNFVRGLTFGSVKG